MIDKIVGLVSVAFFFFYAVVLGIGVNETVQNGSVVGCVGGINCLETSWVDSTVSFAIIDFLAIPPLVALSIIVGFVLSLREKKANKQKVKTDGGSIKSLFVVVFLIFVVPLIIGFYSYTLYRGPINGLFMFPAIVAPIALIIKDVLLVVFSKEFRGRFIEKGVLMLVLLILWGYMILENTTKTTPIGSLVVGSTLGFIAFWNFVNGGLLLYNIVSSIRKDKQVK